MYYSSIKSDISVDLENIGISTLELENIQKSMKYFTTGISSISEVLQAFISSVSEINSDEIGEIIKIEKLFVVNLIQQFLLDTHNWIKHHYGEINDETKQIEHIQTNTNFKEGKAMLELQKKRLINLMNNIIIK